MPAAIIKFSGKVMLLNRIVFKALRFEPYQSQTFKTEEEKLFNNVFSEQNSLLLSYLLLAITTVTCKCITSYCRVKVLKFYQNILKIVACTLCRGLHGQPDRRMLYVDLLSAPGLHCYYKHVLHSARELPILLNGFLNTCIYKNEDGASFLHHLDFVIDP
ncbi:hypothetical protein FF38_07722 [Lucilia cuprina]|uniref:Uncharacterized protein n=1 Tax=Lucilia cuprina TaxID=7375 RepID=A0A0L0BKV5_LUCCU|nr:hypothetical protein FF38_07722 [Lucilia cuprina]